ncbi:MAG: hypothetical protein LUD15_11595 [Bacteroides sp.]|nr:hypothetical protein [Bacteroides sp.]
MRTYICILVALCILLPVSQAQTLVAMDLRQEPLRELLNVVEATTSYRVFCNLQIADTTKVTVTLTSGDPVRILSEVVNEKDLELSIYQDHIFIVPRETEFRFSCRKTIFFAGVIRVGKNYLHWLSSCVGKTRRLLLRIRYMKWERPAGQ